MPTFMNFSPQTSYTKLSRVHTKIILFHGLRNISKLPMALLMGCEFLMKSIEGLLEFCQCQFISHSLLRVALVPLFPGLWRFKQGCNFQQWTGNDSKAFMKVHLLNPNLGHMLILHRFLPLHLKATSLLTLSRPLPCSWTSVILPV